MSLCRPLLARHAQLGASTHLPLGNVAPHVVEPRGQGRAEGQERCGKCGSLHTGKASGCRITQDTFHSTGSDKADRHKRKGVKLGPWPQDEGCLGTPPAPSQRPAASALHRRELFSCSTRSQAAVRPPRCQPTSAPGAAVCDRPSAHRHHAPSQPAVAGPGVCVLQHLPGADAVGQVVGAGVGGGEGRLFRLRVGQGVCLLECVLAGCRNGHSAAPCTCKDGSPHIWPHALKRDATHTRTLQQDAAFVLARHPPLLPSPPLLETPRALHRGPHTNGDCRLASRLRSCACPRCGAY
eukprot:364762-Chlamydomonas_euryale.AAC.2